MGGKRVYELILEIGHVSKPLSKRLPNGYTHKWTAFVRGVNDSKIEHCIQRVVFQLHESFDNPYREVTSPPFQMKETGYAGFEIPIQIYFKNREKPNHLVFVHDLCLLTNKPNEQKTSEKIKFINPNKEFEKCLIKSGAQLLTVPVKNKERSDSPPAKKQKSSSLIPSKDMSKQSPSPQNNHHNHHHQNHNHHHHHHHQNHNNHNHNHQNNINHHNHQHQNNNNNNNNNNNHHSHHREFLDVFGAPLVYNGNGKEIKSDASKQDIIKQDIIKQDIIKQDIIKHHEVNKHEGKKEHLQMIQTKISCLTDSNRLQKIVDIVEEAGEWFNLTSEKFEFDLKRLDKKTLNRIERCLN